MMNLEGIGVVFNAGMAFETVALDDFSLDLAAGDFAAVIGGNGAGKSTLLNVMAGVVKPRSGRIMLDGIDVTGQPEHRQADRIARIFQDPLKGGCDRLSLVENMALASSRGLRRGCGVAINGASRRRFAEALRELDLGLEDRLDDAFGLFSGGQRQAVSLVMATLAPTRLLLLDEHCAALDPRMARIVMDLTDKIIRQYGMTALMVTHSMKQALTYGNRLLMLNDGRLILDHSGAAKEALTIEALLAAFERVGAADGDRLRLDTSLVKGDGGSTNEISQ